MSKVFLVDEGFVKGITNISDNMAGKLLYPAIQEAQDNGLQHILGTKLYNKLIELVDNDTIREDENEWYKELAKQCQYFLAYEALSNIIPLTAFKIDNAGISQVTDENMNPVNVQDIFSLQGFYRKKADYYAQLLQNFLLNNSTHYPELGNNAHSIKTNLYSSASCGLFLGGMKGRGIKICR